MKTIGRANLVLFAALLGGCGGSGSDGNSPPTSYAYIAPQVNSQLDYSQVITDSANNTINETITQAVTTVNSDGSYVYTSADPTGNSVVVDGTTYSIPTETVNSNNNSQVTSYSYVDSGGATVTCTYDPHGNGPDYPLVVGNTWNQQYTLTCGTAAATTYTQSGTVSDVESVTVPAGTYTAVKLTSTVSWTTAAGTTISQAITNWRDVKTQNSVKRTIVATYGGTLPTTGYAVNTTTELQSSSN
jgi:hypothetical protein